MHKNLITVVLIILCKVSITVGESYNDRFMELYNIIKSPNTGYFSEEGIPYHALETFMIEALDYGHLTTSEAFSYWIWLEVMYGKETGNWQPLRDAYTKLEKYIIPDHSNQPTNDFYTPSSPSKYAPVEDDPLKYPVSMEDGVSGQDPLADELKQAYGTSNIYGMHWLLDVDNWYGFGQKNDGISRATFINSPQRGPYESTWEGIPHPSWEEFTYGGKSGYLPFFVADASYAKQWRYTVAPDADARVVQAMYWAIDFVKEQGKDPKTELPLSEASKMGDYLRYCMYDKHFRPIGTESKFGGSGGSAHYLLSWNYAWGGSHPESQGGWGFRIGGSDIHMGYQNPMTAYALSTLNELKPISQKGVSDWDSSYQRQVEYYKWQQATEGAIAAGATNSWNGKYESYPSGTPTFYDLAWVEAPVFLDPPSNLWFGWQAWSMERMCALYYLTDNPIIEDVVEKWATWATETVEFDQSGDYWIPVTLKWNGQPGTWNKASKSSDNTNLHVEVDEMNQDVGIAGCLARALTYYAAGTEKRGELDSKAKSTAKGILDGIWARHRDQAGVSVPEFRGDYQRLFEEIPVPASYSATMPNGDKVETGATFLSIRSKYKDDPDFNRVKIAVDAGEKPEFSYHRFWAQIDVAVALADYARLFPNDKTTPIGIKTNIGIKVNLSVCNNRIYLKGFHNNDAEVSIHTLKGQKIKSFNQVKNNLSINTKNFAQGMYLINIKVLDKTLIKKIVIK